MLGILASDFDLAYSYVGFRPGAEVCVCWYESNFVARMVTKYFFAEILNARELNYMDVVLKDVTIANFSDVIKLKVEKNQERFVPSSCYLIAASKFHPNHQARAIYFECTVVGLALYQTGDGDFEPHECEIFGFMIDRSYQNKGIGKIALQLLVREIEATNQFTWIELSCDPDNEAAMSVYRKIGMLPTHRKDDGSIVFSIEK